MAKINSLSKENILATSVWYPWELSNNVKLITTTCMCVCVCLLTRASQLFEVELFPIYFFCCLQARERTVVPPVAARQRVHQHYFHAYCTYMARVTNGTLATRTMARCWHRTDTSLSLRLIFG